MRNGKTKAQRRKGASFRERRATRDEKRTTSDDKLRRNILRRATLVALFAFALCLSTFDFPSVAQKESEYSPAQSASFHRWGAVTIFHGLPSDRVRAIAQDAEGLMWFGTDAGLARYDGRRTQTVSVEGLISRRILALRFDAEGALWIGTDAGAFLRTPEGEFKQIEGTKGKTVSAIITPARSRAIIATSDGLVLECRKRDDETYAVAAITERIAPTSSGAAGASVSQAATGSRQPLELTSLASVDDTIFVGTRGRGLLAFKRGEAAKEIVSRPRAFFIEAVERDAEGRLHVGVQTSGAESGLFKVEGEAKAERDASGESLSSPFRAAKVAGEATGTITALRFDRRGDLYAGTDGRGVFRLREGERVERFTFASTAGALRSDHILSIFIDREGVAWFGTDRGVCRYDPHGLRVENISEEASEANFVRAVQRTSTGRLLAGTSRGLYVRDASASSWSYVEALGRRTVYAIAEDARGRILVGTSAGLYASLPLNRSKPSDAIRFLPEEVEREAPEANAPKEDARAEDASLAQESAQATPTPSGEQEKSSSERPAEAARTAKPIVTGSVRAVATLNGSVYVAVYGRGVERLDEDMRRASLWPKAEEDARWREVVSLYAEEGAGRIWIGTNSAGLFIMDEEGVRSDAAYDALNESTVWGVRVGGEGVVWLATSRGLYAHRPGHALMEILPQTDARSVAVSADSSPVPHAWCATAGGGLVNVLLDEQFGPVTARIDAEQGLPSQNAFAVAALDAEDDGGHQTLLVGTARGLALYEPGSAPPVLRPSQLVASRPLPLEELQEGRAVRLEYPQNGLVFEVAASASRTFPEQFQYAFMLQDASGKAIKRKLSHDAQFQVENLKPGNYRITARAFSNDLAPSPAFAFEFVVTKAPFPWTTAALSTLLALALVALVWGYAQHSKIVRAGAELVEANRQLAAARLQLANEAESERRRIARDLHDQTLADLRRLLLLADEMQTDAAASLNNGNGAPLATSDFARAASIATTSAANASTSALDPSVLRAEIESISQEIRRICEDLSPSVLENVGFAAALEWAVAERVAHMPPDCKFAYEFQCPEDLEERLHFPAGVQMQIYRIVQEAVSNVCRHAEAARVRLAVEISERDEFLLTLEDNGRGFDTDKKKTPGGRGLASIRARASMIDAQVRWQPLSAEEGGGTRFTLRKPRAHADIHATPSNV